MRARFWKNVLITLTIGPVTGGVVFVVATDIRASPNDHSVAATLLEALYPPMALLYYAFGQRRPC